MRTQRSTINGLHADDAHLFWDDVYPSAVSVGVGANAPSFTAYNGNLRAYEFIGTGPTEKDMHLVFQMYHSIRVYYGVVIPHIHLYIPDDATGGDVKFGCEYTWMPINSAEPATTTIYGTTTVGASAGAQGNVILSFGEVDATTRGGISSLFSCRIFRDPSDAEDTFGASVWLKSADIHIIKNSLGSRLERSK